jgi:hypothetical protein
MAMVRNNLKALRLILTFLPVFVLFLCFSSFGAEVSTVQIQLLSPQPNSNIEIDDVIIVFSVLQDMEKVSLEGVKLYIDEVDVSASVQLNQGIISFLPLDIKLGAHSVKLQITDTLGKSIKPVLFSFNIVPSTVKYKSTRTTPIIRFSGQNSMTYQVNDVTGPGASARQEPTSSNSLNITASGNYEGINYEMTAVVSSESSFDMQPSDTYTVKIYTDWGGITAGDNFPSYSSIVMTGNRVRGASAYAQLQTEVGTVKLDAVYGQSLKQIESQQTPARNMQALNASYNYDNKLKINAVYLKSDDDEGDGMAVGTDYLGNSVIGTTLEYSPSYDFNMQVNWAKSDTSDLRTGESADVDAPGKAFIGNDSALDASMNANIGSFYTLNAKYSIAGLNFKSFGNPWKSVDVQSINATNTVKLFENKFTLTAGVTLNNDNLSDNKATTTTITTYNGSGSLSLGMNMPMITGTYSFNTTKSEDTGLSGLSADRESTQWSASASEMLSISDFSVSLRGNYGKNDQEDMLNPSSSLNSLNYGGSASVTLPNYSSLSTSYRFSENTFPSLDTSTSTETLTFELSYPLIANVLTARGLYQIDKQSNNLSTVDNKKNSWEINCMWDITSFQRLEATYSYAEYKDSLNPLSSNYQANSINLSYTIMFDDFSY